MNSEKVKEIKELLLRKAKEYESQTLLDILTLINELESENERLNKAINSVRKIDEFAKCRDCTAWSGTDCTRHLYTQGCLKDENNIKRQAVKEFTDKLKIKLFEFFQDNEELDGKISVGPLYVEVIGVEAKDGTIISLGLIDELLKECLND